MLTSFMSMVRRTRQQRVHDLKTKGSVLMAFNMSRTATDDGIWMKAWEDNQKQE